MNENKINRYAVAIDMPYNKKIKQLEAENTALKEQLAEYELQITLLIASQ